TNEPLARPVYLSDSAAAERPAVVWTGTMYLVFWIEADENPFKTGILMQRVSRDGVALAAPAHLGYAFNIAAAASSAQVALVFSTFGRVGAIRLTSDGQPIDTQPLLVTTSDASNPVVASNGTDFLIAWLEGFEGEFPSPDRTDIHAARLGASGTVEPSFAIAIGPNNQRSAAIASDGRDYVIVYAEAEPSSGGAVVSKKVLREGALAGTTADAPGQLIATRAEEPLQPAIAALPNGYVVAWEESTGTSYAELRLTTIDRSGAPTRDAVLIAGNESLGMTPALTMTRSGTGSLFYSQLETDAAYGTSMRLLMSKVGEAPQKRRSARH
ncbi:MAG TPA: hypothetical protein VE010_06350, partial [Thermoanaerobaculia bacterium]|nr:hypothetical protein [Thermoanaerobaculia bacterium]